MRLARAGSHRAPHPGRLPPCQSPALPVRPSGAALPPEIGRVASHGSQPGSGNEGPPAPDLRRRGRCRILDRVGFILSERTGPTRRNSSRNTPDTVPKRSFANWSPATPTSCTRWRGAGRAAIRTWRRTSSNRSSPTGHHEGQARRRTGGGGVGRPAAGLAIRRSESCTGRDARRRRHGTDRDGARRAASTPADGLAVNEPSGARPANSERDPEALVLRLLSADTGQPVPNVAVDYWSWTGTAVGQDTSRRARWCRRGAVSTLQPAETVTVTVVLPDGQPAARCDVGFISPGADLALLPGSLERRSGGAVVTPDAAGRVSLPADQAVTLGVAAHPQGFAMAPRTAMKTEPVLPLHPWARVEGRIWSGGNPAAGRELSLRWADKDSEPLHEFDCSGFHVTSDARGAFVFERVPPIELQLVELVSRKTPPPERAMGRALNPLEAFSAKPRQTVFFEIGKDAVAVRLWLRWLDGVASPPSEWIAFATILPPRPYLQPKSAVTRKRLRLGSDCREYGRLGRRFPARGH